MQYDMEDLIDQANEVQESMSRSYGVPDELDEADLEAGGSSTWLFLPLLFCGSPLTLPLELDALGDDFAEEEQGIPSYLREDAVGELPDFADEPAKEEVRLLFPAFSRLSLFAC